MGGNPGPIVERAYELARSGQCANIGDIRQQLKRDGYSDAAVQVHLEGKTLYAELRSLRRKAKEAEIFRISKVVKRP